MQAILSISNTYPPYTKIVTEDRTLILEGTVAEISRDLNAIRWIATNYGGIAAAKFALDNLCPIERTDAIHLTRVTDILIETDE